MSSSGYLDYTFLLVPDRSKKGENTVMLDLDKYGASEMKKISTKPIKSNDFYKAFRNQLYKISTKRIEERFVEDMNESERKHPNKIQSAPGHSGLKTDCWKVIGRDKSVTGRGIQLNFRVQNQQKDYTYHVVVTPDMRGGARSMMNAYVESQAHVGETGTGTIMYTGIVGNLTARKLTRRHGELQHDADGKLIVEGDELVHQSWAFSDLRAHYEYRNRKGEYTFSRGFKKIATTFRYWDGSDWIFRKHIPIVGSESYRCAIDYTIREALIDEVDYRDYGVSVNVMMFK